MRLALLTDLHANRDAVEACLGKLRRAGYDRMVILGDIVGYGADPEWTVDTVRTLVADGAVAVYGNHDEAVLHTPPTAQAGNGATQKHAHAQAAIDWTRGRLDDDQRAFLAALPLQQLDGDRLYVHANAWAPAQWGYISNALAAAQSIAATPQRVTFCGHVHAPALYHSQTGGGARAFLPTPGVGVPLVASRRWVVLPGSCGQPRDGNPAACYALHDEDAGTLTHFRVAYDAEAAAKKIIEAGLPERLAWRLTRGE